MRILRAVLGGIRTRDGRVSAENPGLLPLVLISPLVRLLGDDQDRPLARLATRAKVNLGDDDDVEGILPRLRGGLGESLTVAQLALLIKLAKMIVVNDRVFGFDANGDPRFEEIGALGRLLLKRVNASDARGDLGLGPLATLEKIALNNNDHVEGILPLARGGLGGAFSSLADLRDTGLLAQPASALLLAIAALTAANRRGKILAFEDDSTANPRLETIGTLGRALLGRSAASDARADLDLANHQLLTVLSDGRLGLGVSPDGKLDVSRAAPGTVGAVSILSQFRSDAGNSVMLRILSRRHSSGSDWSGLGLRIQHRVDTTDMGYVELNPIGAAQGLAFGSAGTERARISNAGRFLIGMTSDAGTAPLQVSGDFDIRDSGTLRFNGTGIISQIRSLLTATSVANARTALELGTLATVDRGALAVSDLADVVNTEVKNLLKASSDANASTALSNLGAVSTSAANIFTAAQTIRGPDFDVSLLRLINNGGAGKNADFKIGPHNGSILFRRGDNDADVAALLNTGRMVIGGGSEDGSGASLQVAGHVNIRAGGDLRFNNLAVIAAARRFLTNDGALSDSDRSTLRGLLALGTMATRNGVTDADIPQSVSAMSENRLIRSEQFEVSATWVREGLSNVLADVWGPPNRPAIGDRLVENTATSPHRIAQSGIPISGNMTYTISISVRAHGTRHLVIRPITKTASRINITNDVYFNFNLTTGAFLGASSTGLTPRAGWVETDGDTHRCIINFTSETLARELELWICCANAAQVWTAVPSYAGSTSAGLDVWGAQVNVSEIPSLYRTTIDARFIPKFDAERVTSGILDVNRIPDIAASKITGQVADAQIAGMAANKLVGQVADAQISGMSASKLSGAMPLSAIPNIVNTPAMSSGSMIAIPAVWGNTFASRAITVASAASRVMVMVQADIQFNFVANAAQVRNVMSKVLRGSTVMIQDHYAFEDYVGAADHYNIIRHYAFYHVDTPGSGSHTYQVQFMRNSPAGTPGGGTWENSVRALWVSLQLIEIKN